MGLLDSIRNIFSSARNSNIIEIFVEDDKCGKKFKILLRKSYEISRVYENQGDIKYKVNKVVVCDKCFNKIIFTLGFGKNYHIISREIEGGKFITEKEFNQKS